LAAGEAAGGAGAATGSLVFARSISMACSTGLGTAVPTAGARKAAGVRTSAWTSSAASAATPGCKGLEQRRKAKPFPCPRSLLDPRRGGRDYSLPSRSSTAAHTRPRRSVESRWYPGKPAASSSGGLRALALKTILAAGARGELSAAEYGLDTKP